MLLLLADMMSMIFGFVILDVVVQRTVADVRLGDVLWKIKSDMDRCVRNYIYKHRLPHGESMIISVIMQVHDALTVDDLDDAYWVGVEHAWMSAGIDTEATGA